MRIAGRLNISLLVLMSSLLTTASFAQSTSSVMPQRLFWLPHEIRETSALVQRNDMLWTINDSGDYPRLYGVSLESGKVERKLRVTGAVSEDWESLAIDDQFLYIADTGNNRGDRAMLDIYRVKLTDLDEALVEVDASKQNFRYADYVKHTKGRAKYHNVDCEAITVVNNQLWMFTKNRGDHKTRLYQLALDNQQEQVLEPAAEFDVGGLITAVDYNRQTSELAILGYGAGLQFGEGFIWLVSVAPSGEPDWQNARKISLLEAGQWEAILWQADNRLLLTAERSVYGAQRMAEVVLPKAADKNMAEQPE